MREIKLRAWDTLKVRMVEVCGIDFSNGNPSVLHSKSEGEVTKADTMSGGRYTLMQYTGLKDKNGKEIYEGDIVRFYFKTGEAIYACEWISKDRGWMFSGWFMNDDDIGHCEVIGNIYGSPDLLK